MLQSKASSFSYTAFCLRPVMFKIICVLLIAEISATISYFPVLPKTGQIVDRLHGAVALASVSNSLSHSIPLELVDSNKGNPREYINAEGGALTQLTRGENLEVSGGTISEPKEVSTGPETIETESILSTEEVATTSAIVSVSPSTTVEELLPEPPKGSLYGEAKRIDGSSSIAKGYVNILIDNEAMMETSSTSGVSTVNVDIEAESTAASTGAATSTGKECPYQNVESELLPTTATTPATTVSTTSSATKCPGNEYGTKTESPLTMTATTVAPQESTTTNATDAARCHTCIKEFLKRKSKILTTTSQPETEATTTVFAETTSYMELPNPNPYEDETVLQLLQNETAVDNLSVEKDDSTIFAGPDENLKGAHDYGDDEDYADEDIKDAHSLLDAINARFRDLFHSLKSQISRHKDSIKSSNATEVSPSKKSHEATLQKILEKPLRIPLDDGWHKFEMDCGREEDGFGKRCDEWADSGLCSTNAATRFLWCRRTCLCVGPSHLRS
ncbi:hypothetical protein QR680_001526 [Steinernema hermaphroditum]|uniref:ShKT domain-containing protein n=1 Tax=Steinernema hermaphroditum TaxID=289476 RepID=A0AA39LG79_9BILA|nr:hypothetical protein QR680_001526 [Steinernema hermaphroditum]